MNEANEFYEDMRARRQNADTTGDSASQSSISLSGNGEEINHQSLKETKDGTTSLTTKGLDPTPNG